MNWTTFFQKFGALEARSQQSAKDSAEIKSDLRSVKEDVTELRSFQDKQRGMWLAVATVAAVIGAVLGILASYLRLFQH